MIVLIVILAIIAVAGFVATTAIRKGLNPKGLHEGRTWRILGVIRAAVVCACLTISVLAMLLGSIRIMDQTEVGIVKTFGRVDFVNIS